MGELFGRHHDEKTDEPAVRLVRPRRRNAEATAPVDVDAVEPPAVDVSMAESAVVEAPEVEGQTVQRADPSFAPPRPSVAPGGVPEGRRERVARATPEAPPRPAPLPGPTPAATPTTEFEETVTEFDPGHGETRVAAPATEFETLTGGRAATPKTTTGTHAHKRGHHQRSASPSGRELRSAGEGAPKQVTSTGRGKRLVVALVALAVIVFVGRGLVQHSMAPQSAGGPKHGPATVPSTTTPPAPVIVNGTQIMPSGPLITLNPALAQPGSMMDVNGAGFDAGSMVDLTLRVSGVLRDAALGSVIVDKSGNINMNVAVPENVSGSSVLVIAKQRNSTHTATAEAASVSGIGTVTLGKGSGKPGDMISISAKGFSPNETINVYWGRVSGAPAATVQADGSGGIGQAPVRIGTGVVGQTTVVLVGAKSGTAATAPFYMNGLYPSAVVSPYAVKAKHSVTLSGKGFAPNEPVDVYINSSAGLPIFKTTSDSQGSVHGASLEIPYGLRAKQSVVMVGELSRASVSSGFTILPYTPSAQPSTYGGAVGTSFSFFVTGFGPDEVVLVTLGGGQGQSGNLVSAFRVDDKGSAGAVGSFQVVPGDQGILHFTLTGRQSQSSTSVAFPVSAPVGPVGNIPPRQPYVLPPDLAQDQPSGQPGAPGSPSASPSTEPGSSSPSTSSSPSSTSPGSSTPSSNSPSQPSETSPPTSAASVAWRSQPGDANPDQRVMRTATHRSWWQTIVHFFHTRMRGQLMRHRTTGPARHRSWLQAIAHFFRL
jgi:hypothetical protein